MPRWPAGLHAAAGSLPAAGQRPRRPAVTPQHHYWRRVDTELDASASVSPRFIPLGPVFSIQASIGPTAAGERWSVDMVQLNSDGLVGAPPLVAQQLQAQISGTTTAPPPPVVGQVWLSAGGVNLHLLAQTSQGGNDNVGLGGQPVTTGEAITVVWFLSETISTTAFIRTCWFVLRGTRHTLSQL
jgi:hypothetical protein